MEETFSIDELFQAYFDCRKSKRNASSALTFELNYERELARLYDELNSGSYEVWPSVAFIVTKPVKREIFAAQFRDRVVHHLLVNRLNPLFEKTFIYDSYACRVGKGSLFGVKRVSDFIRKSSNNYSRDAYILKLDVQGFFINIRRDLLLERIIIYLEKHQDKLSWKLNEIFFSTLSKVLLNNPTEACILKSPLHLWDDLPVNKSILKMNGYFGVDHSISTYAGLPIGNLTSQVFANFYMHSFDHYMKHNLRLKYYGRYVDDMVVVHEDKDFLLQVREKATAFLLEQLNLRVHPQKHYLQHYTKGVPFLGVYIAPHFTYPGKRIKSNCYAKLHYWNRRAGEERNLLQPEEKDRFRAQINSYLGFMVHHQTYKLRRKLLLSILSPAFFRYGYVVNMRKIGYK